jgi:hypothetical protein
MPSGEPLGLKGYLARRRNLGAVAWSGGFVVFYGVLQGK